MHLRKASEHWRPAVSRRQTCASPAARCRPSNMTAVHILKGWHKGRRKASCTLARQQGTAASELLVLQSFLEGGNMCICGNVCRYQYCKLPPEGHAQGGQGGGTCLAGRSVLRAGTASAKEAGPLQPPPPTRSPSIRAPQPPPPLPAPPACPSPGSPAAPAAAAPSLLERFDRHCTGGGFRVGHLYFLGSQRTESNGSAVTHAAREGRLARYTSCRHRPSGCTSNLCA